MLETVGVPGLIITLLVIFLIFYLLSRMLKKR